MAAGWVQMDYDYALTGAQDLDGVTFDIPERQRPPHDVDRRRPIPGLEGTAVSGATFGIWHNTYNDSITGDSLWQYPEFKGYYADVRWMTLQTIAGPITVAMNQEDLFLQVLTPKFPPANLARHTAPAFPVAGLSLLNAIPPIGSKFATAASSGPSGQQAVAAGDYHGSVSFFFGQLPH